jgi:hypothetical protein
MPLQPKTKNVRIAHMDFKFTCTPEPSETEYLDTNVYADDSYFCSITWLDIDKFIEELQSIIGKYSI